MKKILLVFSMLLVWLCPAVAQNGLNDNADNIVGTYSGVQGKDKFRAKIVKLTDGSYRGQVIWMENDKDAQGNKRLDTKNPDKKLRDKPADQVILFSGLKYNAKKKRWDDTKIYDPQRGIRANLTVEFMSDGRLKLRGSIMGIGESVYWTKEK